MPILLKKLRQLSGYPLHLIVHPYYIGFQIPSLSHTDHPLFASMPPLSTQQVCSAFFIKHDYPQYVPISSVDSIDRLTIEIDYIPFFLKNLGYTVINRGLLTDKLPAYPFKNNDKIVFLSIIYLSIAPLLKGFIQLPTNILSTIKWVQPRKNNTPGPNYFTSTIPPQHFPSPITRLPIKFIDKYVHLLNFHSKQNLN